MRKEQKNLVRASLRDPLLREVKARIENITKLSVKNEFNEDIVMGRERTYSDAVEKIVKEHTPEEDITNLLDEWDVYKHESEKLNIIYNGIHKYLSNKYYEVQTYVASKIMLFLFGHSNLIQNKRDITDFFTVLTENNSLIMTEYTSFYGTEAFEFGIRTPYYSELSNTWIKYDELSSVEDVKLKEYQNAYFDSKKDLATDLPSFDELTKNMREALNASISERNDIQALRRQYDKDEAEIIANYKEKDTHNCLQYIDDIPEDLK